MTNVAIPPSGTGDSGKSVATETIGGVEYQLVKVVDGTPASTTPVTPLTDTQLRATAVPVSGTVTASGPLTDTQLRATAVPISGTVTANVGTGTQPVSGTVTANAGTGTLAVSGPLTDTQLRATAVPVSGTVTATVGTVTAVTTVGTVSAITAVPLPTLATTGTTSQVNDTASSTTILASNAARKGFRVWNDSTSTLYVKYGTTASLTDCTVKLPADGYLEENFYSGRVDGIWSVDGSGAARVTELT